MRSSLYVCVLVYNVRCRKFWPATQFSVICKDANIHRLQNGGVCESCVLEIKVNMYKTDYRYNAIWLCNFCGNQLAILSSDKQDNIMTAGACVIMYCLRLGNVMTFRRVIMRSMIWGRGRYDLYICMIMY